MKEKEIFVLLVEGKEVRAERRISKAQRACTLTYDCDSIMWTDDMGVFLKYDTPHSNDDLTRLYSYLAEGGDWGSL